MLYVSFFLLKKCLYTVNVLQIKLANLSEVLVFLFTCIFDMSRGCTIRFHLTLLYWFILFRWATNDCSFLSEWSCSWVGSGHEAWLLRTGEFTSLWLRNFGLCSFWLVNLQNQPLIDSCESFYAYFIVDYFSCLSSLECTIEVLEFNSTAFLCSL